MEEDGVGRGVLAWPVVNGQKRQRLLSPRWPVSAKLGKVNCAQRGPRPPDSLAVQTEGKQDNKSRTETVIPWGLAVTSHRPALPPPPGRWLGAPRPSCPHGIGPWSFPFPVAPRFVLLVVHRAQAHL